MILLYFLQYKSRLYNVQPQRKYLQVHRDKAVLQVSLTMRARHKTQFEVHNLFP